MTPEITKTEATRRLSIPNYVWTTMALLAVLTYFLGLNLPLLGPDEPRYAQVAREMFDKGDWVTPTLGGFTWFEKPALLYWLEIASYYVFGVSEFAARFGSALFGLGTVASLWILGRTLATENTEFTEKARDPQKDEDSKSVSDISVPSVAKDFSNYLALIAASTLGILVFSHGASFDINITFPITAALVSFFIFDQAPASPRQRVTASLVLFYFFIGVALLAKGLIGIIFPFAIVACYHVLSWKLPSGTLVASLFWGTAIALAVASIWYIPVYLRNGWPFIDEFFIQHHFQRFITNKFQHPQPFYFFLWVLPLMTLPWLPFFIAAVWSFIREIFHHRATEGTESASTKAPLLTKEGWRPLRPTGWFSLRSPLALFSVAWLLVPLVFFSFSGSKLPGYILPAVPAAIILTAIYIFHLVEKSRKWRIAIISLATSVFAVAILLILFALPRFADTDSVRGLLAAANERGYPATPVYGLHTISHSAEFYAAGRLLHDPDGKQKKLYSPAEVVSEMQRAGTKRALVLVPVEYQKQLTESNLLHAEIIRDNTELAIVAVSIE